MDKQKVFSFTNLLNTKSKKHALQKEKLSDIVLNNYFTIIDLLTVITR